MSDPIADVAALERHRCAATSAGDVDALRALFSDDYVHCHATGMIHTREEMIQHVEAHPREIEPREPDIRVFGDTAVLTGRMVSWIERPAQEKLRLSAYVTQVACKFRDAWRFVSFQATVIPE